VDFVLAYDTKSDTSESGKKRDCFEKNLKSEGLVLETERKQRINFIKISASKKVLARYCEIMKMKMPLKEMKGQETIMPQDYQVMNRMKSFFGKPLSFIKLDTKLFPTKKYELHHEYSRGKGYL
jgi:anoctamin-1